MTSRSEIALRNLLAEVRNCRYCEQHLPLGPNPVVRAATGAKLLIIGQAPGTRVHASGIPWNDPSGDRLRQWMGVDRKLFYDENRIAIIPMGFCYPGKGKSGDLPPRRECADLWHARLFSHLPAIRTTLLVGSYAQQHYLDDGYSTLTERVKNWRSSLPRYLPLVHPSPRNRLWLAKNPWFEEELVPELRTLVQSLLVEPFD